MEQGLRSIQMIVNRPNFLDFGFGNSHGASIKTYILVAIKKKKTGKNKVTHREGTIIEPYCLLEALLHIIFGLKAASKVVIISLLEDETKAQEKLINLPTNIRPMAKQRNSGQCRIEETWFFL